MNGCVIPHPHFGPCDIRLENVSKVVGYMPVTDEMLADAEAWREALDRIRRGDAEG